MTKSLEEKISEIRNVLEKEEITRKEIDNHAEYCIVRRILNGQNVKENSADRLLAKIKKIRIKRGKGKKQKRRKTEVKEQVIEYVIEEDTHKKSISGKDDIEKQNNVKEASVSETEKLVAYLREENDRLRQENQSLKEDIKRKEKERRKLRKNSITVKEASTTVTERSATTKEDSATIIEQREMLFENIERHELMMKEVLDRIENIEKQIAIEISIARKEKNPRMHGFSVSQLSSGYWQAVRRINGHPQCVYIGKDVNLAQEKIEKWLAKHHPDMLKEGT